MPSPATIFVWLNKFPGISGAIRDGQGDPVRDPGRETKEVADTPRVGKKVKTFADGSQEVTEGDMVDRSRLMVDTRKWLLSKMFPKKYGDKIDAASD
jgi:hypothetical protein